MGNDVTIGVCGKSLSGQLDKVAMQCGDDVVLRHVAKPDWKVLTCQLQVTGDMYRMSWLRDT